MKSIYAACLFVAITSTWAEPVSIFDGKTLKGWEGDAKWWRVEDGQIVGGSATQAVDRNYFVATEKSYHNFDLRLKLKLTGTEGFINSGVQIRSARVPNNTEMSGYQVDAGDGWWGKMYDESRRNKVVAEAKDLAAVNAAVKKGDWNEYRVRAEGPRVQSWINGVPAIDYTEPDVNIAQDGQIGVQIHAGGKTLVYVKDVTIEELAPTPTAPTWDKVGRPGGKKPAAEKAGAGAYNGSGAGPKTAAEERATFKVPDGLEVELVAAEDPANGIGKFVAVYFDQRGAMWTMTALEYPVDGNENSAAADALYQSRAKDKILVYDRDPKSPTGFAKQPRVFAEGLAIPLGILPYKDGCYVQHGHDLVLLRDTDGDGKADKREVILTGFGVQDSHLFPHQFTRAPGGWIWMAQGAFNYSKVSRPGEPPENAIKFDQTRMAKFRPDGSEFTITSQGPCNIWGLAMNAEGETFIQEANDYGYPVMPFHEFANYPGCSDSQMKSYAPEFPGTAPHFKMGGTGLSGLALTDKDGIYPDAWRDMMLVANPITNRVQAIKMHRDGPYWKLEEPKDFVTTTDPWFRPVALTLAPDGCVYIVDWYNKIISHNEVPRTHPDRDKTRGRIWRVKPKGKALMEVPDFTKLSDEGLIAKLGGPSGAQHHLAWQTISDRKSAQIVPTLRHMLADALAPSNGAATHISALWALEEIGALEPQDLTNAFQNPNPNVRREGIRAWGNAMPPMSPLQEFGRVPSLRRVEPSFKLSSPSALIEAMHSQNPEQHPEVRAAQITAIAAAIGWLHNFENAPNGHDALTVRAKRKNAAFAALLTFARAPLAEPVAPSTRNGKPQKVREAYNREFERYLVRMFLERHPESVAKFLDSDDGKRLPIEAQLLASLSLAPKASASRVAALLPQLKRAPEREEILRLMQFLDEAGVADAVRGTLSNPVTAPAVLAALLELQSRLDPTKLAPLINDAATNLLSSKDTAQLETGLKLAGAFKLTNTEPAVAAVVEREISETHGWFPGEPGHRTFFNLSPAGVSALKALREMQSGRIDLLERLSRLNLPPAIRSEAVSAMAASRATDAPQRLIKLYPELAPLEQRLVLNKLTATKPGATAIVAAIQAATIPKTQVDPAMLDRLLAVLGDKDPALNALVESVGSLFRPVLALDGSDNAFTQTEATLEGVCTIEAWVRLDTGIGNADGIFGAPGQLDLNFYDSHFRVWAGNALHDVAVAKKTIVPDMWTHVAASRDAAGIWKLYIDGELDTTGTKPAPQKIETGKIGWTGAPGGTKGQIAEFRIWKRERSAQEIRANFDRALPDGSPELVVNASGNSGWGKFAPGAKVVKTSDVPPVLSADAAAKLDSDFAKYTALAAKAGDVTRGRALATVCRACHLMGTEGGQIGPNLSGVGAMGTEAILRNILTPNAAMESAYRIFRVEQQDGSVLDAFFVNEDKDAVVARLPGAPDQRIPKSNVRSTKFLRRSLMPEGLLEAFTPEQVSDLFAYLKSLK